MEHKREIKLAVAEDVKEFVASASRCDFDIDIFYNSVIVDAKSIMGILCMDLSNKLTVKYEGCNPEFEMTLQKFQAA